MFLDFRWFKQIFIDFNTFHRRLHEIQWKSCWNVVEIPSIFYRNWKIEIEIEIEIEIGASRTKSKLESESKSTLKSKSKNRNRPLGRAHRRPSIQDRQKIKGPSATAVVGGRKVRILLSTPHVCSGLSWAGALTRPRCVWFSPPG